MQILKICYVKTPAIVSVGPSFIKTSETELSAQFNS